MGPYGDPSSAAKAGYPDDDEQPTAHAAKRVRATGRRPRSRRNTALRIPLERSEAPRLSRLAVERAKHAASTPSPAGRTARFAQTLPTLASSIPSPGTA
jgi:hypothetical protein